MGVPAHVRRDSFQKQKTVPFIPYQTNLAARGKPTDKDHSSGIPCERDRVHENKIISETPAEQVRSSGPEKGTAPVGRCFRFPIVGIGASAAD